MRTIRLVLFLFALLAASIVGPLVATPSATGSDAIRFEERFGAKDWWKRWGLDSKPYGTEVRTDLLAGLLGNRNPYLRVSFGVGQQFGASWQYDVGAAESAKLTYRVRFSPLWVPIEHGKLPGFGRPLVSDSGGCIQGCGRRPVREGEPYYSARASYDPLNNASSHIYAPRCNGDETALTMKSLDWTGVTFRNGRWYKVEQELTMNTPGEHDGSLIVRVDGREVFRAEDLCLRTSADVPIGNVLMQFFHGGRLPSLSPLNWIDLDDVVIEH